MHGIIFSQLKNFVDTNLGPNAWTEIVKNAGLTNRLYTAIQEYPDSEMTALVGAATKMTGQDPAVLLEKFGEFIAPTLMDMYGSLIDKKWRTLDLIENTEETIHRVVRMRNKGAKPPELKVERKGPNELLLTYTSPRRLCSVARGIAHGVAKYYREQIRIDEPTCMLKGGRACLLTIRGS